MGAQTKVLLTILGGPEKGKTFEFADQENFLVGRNAPGSCAHFRLNPKDQYVSRNHFLIEINPPDCYLRDTESLNGTLIVRRVIITGSTKMQLFCIKGRDTRNWYAWAAGCAWRLGCDAYEVVEGTIKLEDGDTIWMGETEIKVNIVVPKSHEEAPGGEEAEEILQCIQCGRRLPIEILDKEPEALRSEDFICKKCLESRRRSAVSRGGLLCWRCGKDISGRANSDGRAEELRDIALYWCEECAHSNREGGPLSSVGRYLIEKELGSGGFGVVYLAWDEATGRIVALKVTREKIKRSKDLLLRFKREIVIMKALDHPNLVKLYDDGVSKEKNYYLVSEYLPEGSLADFSKKHYRGTMPYGEACYFVAQALDGLSYLHGHEKGFVHRDMKPENILLRKDDKGRFIAKVGDFGLARSYVLHGGTITKPGEWAGTVFYCPPEQITDFKNVKPCADVYAMGMSLYHLITGGFPYDFPTRDKLREMISKGVRPRDAVAIILGDDKPVPIEKKVAEIPSKLAVAINKAIDKDPSRRFQTAAEFKNAIERYAI
ncbi:MAG: FHA domain-containing serine/threonine-protein kinase [Candidatus Bathyarchaeia archaeon]